MKNDEMENDPIHPLPRGGTDFICWSKYVDKFPPNVCAKLPMPDADDPRDVLFDRCNESGIKQ